MPEAEPQPADERSRRGWRRAGIALGVLGAVLRLHDLAGNRSLWLDEAMLVNNITSRGFHGLTKPLDDNQGAPVLFLWVERAAVQAFGVHDWVLRLVPVAAGLALLPLAFVAGSRLMGPLAFVAGSRLMGPRQATVAVGLVAFSPALVRYSTEVKQYSTDSAVAVLLLVLALGALRGSRRETIALVVAGAIAPWLSHPAVFVLASIAVVLLVRRRDRQSVVVVGTWAGSIAVEFVVSLRQLGSNDFLLRYWSRGFPDGVLETPRWLAGALVRYTHDPAGFRFGIVVLVAAGLGGLRLRHRAHLVLLPIGFLVLAAVARKFPFQGRVALFALPLLLLLLAAATERAVGLLAVLLLAIPPTVTTARRAVDPFPFPDARGVLTYVRDHRRPDEPVWLLEPAYAVWRYYGPGLGVPADGVLTWQSGTACDPLPTGDAWFVHIYTFGNRPGAAGTELRSALDPVARRTETKIATDASAARYTIAAGTVVRAGTECLQLTRPPG